MLATWHICTAPDDDELAARLVAVMSTLPSMGDKPVVKARSRKDVSEVSHALAALPPSEGLGEFTTRFRAAGQVRSREYEPVIARRFARPLSHGLRVYPGVRPDFVLEEYEPCAVTRATSDTNKAIEVAIRRACHVIEITAHLGPDLRGLADYLRDKVHVYADLLESV